MKHKRPTKEKKAIRWAEYRGLLSRRSPKFKKLRIVGFDSEDDSKGTPISFAFHSDDENFYTRDADEALDYIYNAKEASCFVAHNLEYDIANLMKHCEFRYIDEMTYAGKLLKVTLKGSRNFFMNTSSYFAGSLKSMGNAIKLPKLEGDPFGKEYVLRDAEIPQKFMSKMQDFLNSEGLQLGLSIGQSSMLSFRTNFLTQKMRTFNHPDVLNAYYGGRVEMFFKGLCKEKVYVADINSSYPDVMRNFEYPDTRRMETSFFKSHKYGIGWFKVKVPDDCFIPPLPFRADSGRLFFPTGIFDGWWTYAEIRESLKYGVEILDEREGFGSRYSCNPFLDFIDSNYSLREKYKAICESDPSDADAAFWNLYIKLKMNNLYGKFAQHKDGTMLLTHRMRKSARSKIENLKEDKQGYFWSYKIPRKKAPQSANYLWGVYITSYARISLHRKLVAVHNSGSKLIYCDTDSIMFTGEAGKKVLDFGTGLGRMSLETYDIGIFRQSKGYLLCNKTETGQFLPKKIACKGVPTDQAPDFILKGLATAIKPMRLKEANIRMFAKIERTAKEMEEIGFNVWHEAEKVMRGIYMKRVGNKGITMPLSAENIPEAELHAYGVIEDMTGEMLEAGVQLTPSKPRIDLFRNTLIPDGWFKRTYGKTGTFSMNGSQRTHYLNFNELLDITPGETWFRGEFLYTSSSSAGKLLHNFRLIEWLGKNCLEKNIIGAIPDFVLGNIELQNKVLDIVLVSEYIEGHHLKIKVEIHDKNKESKNVTTFNEGN